jgi:RNA polymerase sigma-54 factor
MNHQQSQSQQQKQGYYMSQQHLKLMHIMHLSGYALQEYITNELELNPALELESDGEESDNAESDKENDEFDSDLLWSPDDDDYAYDISTRQQQQSNEVNYEVPVIQYNSLAENLKDQIRMINLPEDITELAYYMIDELDDDGYLRRPVSEVADDYGFNKGKAVNEEDVAKALHILQSCEPAGIGARDLHDCLLLQLRRRKKDGKYNALATKILEDYYQLFIQRQFARIKSELDISSEDIDNCLIYISKLNPKPVTETNKYELLKEQIIPDFEVSLEDNELFVSLTSSEFTKLKVNPEFASANIARGSKAEKKQVENYFNNLVSDAQSLVNALKERETTMMKVMTVIVQMQPHFFRSGDVRDLQPMILQDIADRTGYDLSTISRITSNKSVQTTFGVFNLKNLFMRPISSDGENTSKATSIQVQELIHEIVSVENKQKPLSDTEIKQLLKEKGVIIARRTVVKYRELSGIPNSEMRKRQPMPMSS